MSDYAAFSFRASRRFGRGSSRCHHEAFEIVNSSTMPPLPSTLTLHEIASAVGAELPLGADPAMAISGATSLEDARSEQIAFYDHPKYLRALRSTKAGVVLVPAAFDEALSLVMLRVASPGVAFSAILDRLHAGVPCAASARDLSHGGRPRHRGSRSQRLH